jgi:hypothetical protein
VLAIRVMGGMSRTSPLLVRPLTDAARAVVQDGLRAPARAPPAGAPVGPHVLALDVSAFPAGAVITHLRVDRTAAAVAKENVCGGSNSTTHGQCQRRRRRLWLTFDEAEGEGPITSGQEHALQCAPCRRRPRRSTWCWAPG